MPMTYLICMSLLDTWRTLKTRCYITHSRKHVSMVSLRKRVPISGICTLLLCICAKKDACNWLDYCYIYCSLMLNHHLLYMCISFSGIIIPYIRFSILKMIRYMVLFLVKHTLSVDYLHVNSYPVFIMAYYKGI